MPSILALDQGTTGSTALVIHQDGSVLGRGYREFTQHFPRPGLAQERLRAGRQPVRPRAEDRDDVPDVGARQHHLVAEQVERRA